MADGHGCVTCPCSPVHCVRVVVVEVGDPFLQLVAALALADAELEQVYVGV